MKDLFKGLSPEARKKPRKKPQPSWTAPMLATLTSERFSRKDWIFERKLDGERCLAFRHGKTVRLMSRNEKQLNHTYPELADALRKQSCDDFIVDGEVVAFQGKATSFSRLQKRMQITDETKARKSKIAVYYYLFDLLYLDGRDVTQLALTDRKALLKNAISFKGPLQFSAHRKEKGESFYKEACRQKWEGLIAKRADSVYVHSRSRDWLKFKCENQQEFVIGGWTDPKGSRIGFGALLIGYYDEGNLRYAGMVGTGYDTATLRRLQERFSSLERDSPAFEKNSLPRQHVHWVSPKLVAQVGFTEWTGDGKLRHPRFLGLRRDKNPKMVVREG